MDLKFDSEPVYGDNEKYIKSKIKLCKDNVNTNFRGKKVPKETASYKYLSLITLDSVIKQAKSIILKHFWKNVNMKQKILKWSRFLMMN